ncbi:MAG TPA: EAL domain-containing protein [Burkholderiales bacterium]|nr:EAL domain-containing protein [Burkholderiales bacterium]
MGQHLKVLIVEDQPTDAELLQYDMRRAGLEFTARRVETQEAFERELQEFEPDLILSDFSMPSFDGLSALDLAQARTPETPFIFVSGTIGEDRAIDALKRGATDYVLKDRPKRIMSAISRALDEAKERAALRDSQQALQSSEKRFRSFMQNVPARASILDLQGRYSFVNENWERMAGRAAQDVLGRSYEETMPPDRAAALAPFLRQVVETGSPVTRIYRAGDGEDARWWCSNYFPIPGADGKLAMIGTVAIDITEQKLQEQQLDYLAYYDALTGLPNPTLMEERLARCLAGAAGGKGRVALAVFNVNRFGIINESLGHQAGDALLRDLAGRLRSAWPDPDQVSRLTSDCFACALGGIENASDLAHALEGVALRVSGSPFAIDGKEIAVTVTAGVAVYPEDGESVDTLVRNAEAALKRAKASSARYAFYQTAMNATVAETLVLEGKLRRALDQEQFVLHYQPKVCLATRKIVGIEALLRWNDPGTGLVPPARFIPLLEETGLIIEVGRWAVRRALIDYRAWRDEGLQPPRIAVNVSAIQVAQADFLDVLSGEIAAHADGAHGLDLEITESLLMQDIDGNIGKLRAMQEMGIGIAIDDFGTGYCSLAYLARLPIDALKIDRSFVTAMTDQADGMSIASTIISLGRSLGLKVIAEGVETEEQHRILRLLKCAEAQGYLFYRPIPAEQLKAVLRAGK